ncbi:Uncharacterised protein [Legionella donaldsonii]|uniref:Uncharacterized protein n=1 Tax=Legionella donaldsonii TaxID=45060 RepID=A0A378J1F0_9GAMM|nr:Uncharacterised protein [Legionella donaldsonii]
MDPGRDAKSKRSLGGGLQGRKPGFTLFHPGYLLSPSQATYLKIAHTLGGSYISLGKIP